MTDRTCPECGSPSDEWVEIKQCNLCGYCEQKTLRLKTETNQIIALGRLATVANSSWIQPYLKNDSGVWDKECQMIFEPLDGNWILKCKENLANDTLIDGKKVVGEASLSNGMIVSVGREASGDRDAVIRSPLKIILE